MKPLLVDLETEWRGGQNQFLLTLRGLRARGHAAELVAPRDSALAERALESGVPVHITDRFLMRLQAGLVLRRLLGEGRFDLVHANEPHALTAAWLAGAHRHVPVVVSRRVGYPLTGYPLSLARYRASSRVIAISHWVAENVAVSGLPKEKISVVYEGVEIPAVPTAEERRRARERWGAKEETQLLGSIGVFLPDKGHELLIRALAILRAELPRVRLLLVGDGPLKPRLERVARGLGVGNAVLFPGFVKDIEAVYMALDVFLFPSRFEGLGTSLLAAMSYGVPSIALDRCAFGEIIEQERSGLLVSEPGVTEMRSAIAAILGDADLARRLGRAARQRVIQKFSADEMVEGTLRVYEKVLRERKSSS